MVSEAANWMSPIIVFAFLACGFVALGQLGVDNFSNFIKTNLLFISFTVSLIIPFLMISIYSLRNSFK